MDSYYLRNSLLATEITSLQWTKLRSEYKRDDWIFCFYKWLILSLLLVVQNSLFEGQGKWLFMEYTHLGNTFTYTKKRLNEE